MKQEVCRIAAKVLETGVEIRGEYVFTPSSIVSWLNDLNTRYAGEIFHWAECIVPFSA